MTIVDPEWMDTSKSPVARANLMLAAMTFEQKIQLALTSSSEQGQSVLGSFHIPNQTCFDGSNGVRGAAGVTAFPAAQALAATFNKALAEANGQAVAEEIRGKGGNTWLGPAMDITRTPLRGRAADAAGGRQVCGHQTR